ncbi:hypothetical protein EII12_05820 [Buchananella hordeovulneris]|uniref:hypothetical protein n=1 Tax=Buchananella hordeovulneris TaxID=52770 RepID=UPI000F5E1E1D|nr:hypothetical protein [Buchananella hordeovulneris]RRD52150.1 hypothetical protein EII12_05820 [Buchananella hordeovulneris]
MSGQTEPSFVPLSPQVRELLEQILGEKTDHGAPQLRAQLPGALEARSEHGWIDFRVRADAPRICGPNYDFPVALAGDDAGAPVWVVLWIRNGLGVTAQAVGLAASLGLPPAPAIHDSRGVAAR